MYSYQAGQQKRLNRPNIKSTCPRWRINFWESNARTRQFMAKEDTKLSKSISPFNEKQYGMVKQCAGWRRCSFFYTRNHNINYRNDNVLVSENGLSRTKAETSNHVLPVLIKKVSPLFPYTGEAQYKVGATLYFCRYIKMSRKQVLRLMREKDLQFLSLIPQKSLYENMGMIITNNPGERWCENNDKFNHGRR